MNWLRNDLLVLILIVLIALAVGFSPMLKRAHAADVSTAKVVMCIKTATTGPIDYYYCEPEIGPYFITNSVGWIEKVD